MTDLPRALIIQWNGRKYHVKCPFCLSTHGHNHPLGDRQRMSHCDDMNGKSYELVFPEEDDPAATGCGWEFDPAKSSFVTVTSAGRLADLNPRKPYRSLLLTFIPLHEQSEREHMSDDADEAAELKSATERLSIGELDSPSPQTDEGFWQEQLASPTYRREMYFAACVTRNIHELRWLFKRYPDDNFSSQVDEKGNNGVLFAATEETGLATLKWLQERGTALDQSNHYGRTPLMEAALWGRLEIVQYLTAKGADVHVRDANGMNALELAAASERNVDERASRASIVYRELANAPRQRARIENHLRNLSNAQIPQRGTQSHSQRGLSYFQRTADGDLFLYRPHTLLQVPNGQGQKAFAELDRGPNYPLVNAMSGYTYATWPNVLDNDLWANRADDLREYLGLSRNIGFASHVEPQLLTYLVFHHTLVTFTDDEEVGQEDLRILSRDLLTLTLAPVITVTKSDFCHSCQQFFNVFRQRFSVLNARFRFVGDNVEGTVQIRP